MTVADMYPKKLQNDGALDVLNGISSIGNDMLISTVHSLPKCDVIITPPHIRAPKGRRPTKRLSKQDTTRLYRIARNKQIQKKNSRRNVSE